MFNFLNRQSKTIASAAFILGAASLISRLVGLVRDRVLAGRFGAGDELDIYYAAFRIPDLVYALLITGALSAGFIPVFVSYLNHQKKDEESNQKSQSPAVWHLVNNVLNILALGLIIVSIILALLAPFLIKLLTPGFGPEKLALVVKLTRVMFLGSFFLGLSAVFGGVLQGLKRFLIFSLAPIMYNLGIIFGALFLVRPFGLLGLAYGVVIGAFFHFLIQMPVVYQNGYHWRPAFDFGFEGVKRIFKLMPARLLSLALSQLTFLAMTVMASLLAVGSIAVYNLSYNIWSFPLGIFGVSFAVAVFPKLSEQAQNKSRFDFVDTFSSSARQILFFTLPLSALFIVLSQPIVRVILGTGQFGLTDINLTSQTLIYFSLGLFAESLILLFLRGFFAWEDTLTPFLIGLFAAVVRLTSAWFLARIYGVSGLALGFSLGSVLYLLLLFVYLRKKLGFLAGRKLVLYGLKILSVSFLTGLAVFGSWRLINVLIQIKSGLAVLIYGCLAGLAGLLVFLFLTRVLGLAESRIIFKSLWQRIGAKEEERR